MKIRGDKMSEKNISHHDSFEKMRKEKEEANMRYISECIHDEYYSADIENIEIPADIDANLIAFCRRKDKEYENIYHTTIIFEATNINNDKYLLKCEFDFVGDRLLLY